MWRRLPAGLLWAALTLVAAVLVSATVDAAVHRVSGPVTATRPNGTGGHAERSAAVLPVTAGGTDPSDGQRTSEREPQGTSRAAMAMAPPDVAAAATAGRGAAPYGATAASPGSAPPATATAAGAPSRRTSSTTTSGSHCCRSMATTTEPRPSSTTTSPSRTTTTTGPDSTSTTTSTTTSTSTTTTYDR